MSFLQSSKSLGLDKKKQTTGEYCPQLRSTTNKNCPAHKRKSLYSTALPFYVGCRVTTNSSFKCDCVKLFFSGLFASKAEFECTHFNYLVRLLQQENELHAHGRQAAAVGAVQAAVAQEHPQQWLVALQPVSPASLAVARTFRLERSLKNE